MSAFLVCQGTCYFGAAIVLGVWPGWMCKLLLTVGLGGPDATGENFSISSAEAGMIRIAAILLAGVGWFYIHGGLSERLHFLAATCLNRAVFVPFMTAMLAILGARVSLCVLFGVLDPLLTMLTYLVLLGCMDASRFCFKLLLPTILAIAAAITCVVAATAAATAYDTSLWDWLTVQICAMVFAMAALTSLCLSSLRCVSDSTPYHDSAAQNGSTSARDAQNAQHALSMFEGTTPVERDAAELVATGHVVAQFGAATSVPNQAGHQPSRPMDRPHGPQQQAEGSQSSGNLQLLPEAAVSEHDDHDDHSEAESEVELFEEPAPQRTSSTGIFSPPPPRPGSQRQLGQEQPAVGTAQETKVLVEKGAV